MNKSETRGRPRKPAAAITSAKYVFAAAVRYCDGRAEKLSIRHASNLREAREIARDALGHFRSLMISVEPTESSEESA